MSTPTGTPSRKPAASAGKDVIVTRDDRRTRDRQKESPRKGDDERGFLKTPAGKGVASLLCIVAVTVAVAELRAYFRGGTPGDANVSTYVDSQTGQTFTHRRQLGDTVPILSPYTNAATGYPGYPCYWTKSGELKTEPTWVILNSVLGKPEPTFCPDCGRLVDPLRPPPKPGDRPPPTRDELLHSIDAH